MLLIPTLLCPKSWEGMSGNESQRFCTYCKKHVHNLEALSVSERLALLSSPAASICSRYQVALRRPAKGKEESYYAHLAKHGAGVALIGSTMLVLWEMQGEADKERFYRAASPRVSSHGTIVWEMPKEHFCEYPIYTVGLAVALPAPKELISSNPADTLPSHVDVHLDPIAIDKLIEQHTPKPVFPVRL